MARVFCQRKGCPRRTKMDRLLCAECVKADRRKAKGPRRVRPVAPEDISEAEIERRFAEAKAAAKRAA
jgi:hypothetical protein